MKKALYLLSLACLLCTCYEGPGTREKYIVSGNVYYPDSTPLPYAGINVMDIRYYWYGLEGMCGPLEGEFYGSTDDNGYFEVVVPDGGMERIEVSAYYRPTCDTDIVMYHYKASVKKSYSGKHGFEGLQLYTRIVEHPQRYPYWVPSCPFIGDSVQIIAQESIQKVEFSEGSKKVLLSMEYQDGDTAVMFFIPDTASLEKRYDFYIQYTAGGSVIAPVHLRKH